MKTQILASLVSVSLLSFVTACGGSSKGGNGAGAASGSRVVSLKSDLEGVASIGISKGSLSLTGGDEGLTAIGFDAEGNALAKKLLAIEDSSLAFTIRNMVTISGSIVADIMILNPEETKTLLPGEIPTEYSVKMDSGLDSVADCNHLIRIKKEDGSKNCFINSGIAGQYVILDYFPMDDGSVIVNADTSEGNNLYAVSSDGLATIITNNSGNERVNVSKNLGEYLSFESNSQYYVWKKGSSPILVGKDAPVAAAGDYVLSANGFSDLEGATVDFTNVTAGYESQTASYIGETVSAAADLVDGKLTVISRNGLVSEVSLADKTISTNNDIEGSGALTTCDERTFVFANHVGFAVDPCAKKILKFATKTSLALTADAGLELQEVVSGVTFAAVKNINEKLLFSGLDDNGTYVVGSIDPTSGEVTKNTVDVAVTALMPF